MAAPESAAPLLCGNDTVYCPAGSFHPLVAGPGYYTEGGSNLTRVARIRCPAGSYCPGMGVTFDCPAGYVVDDMES